ncbi:DNA mismatch repair protein MutL [[Clostridium] ultunense Esp]|uniref:DNA mismatch repair protein MutL n=1 Tax=[Clostridium] ultunense Esp TaxID=1288971 RepID=M1Z4Z1_9FIRM|nr:DNA mismatch repair endonuclease MutL [Schnuerera ultunensis]CCQ93091.1 DNA mismatch repair protein MutL [[Clostridium] ultunense Esp]SHD77097.1 DNA mismatch repair protein MutL [[Clostridium] ultunense Esp]
MTKIKILDEFTIQKIAAGEIIERPSSVIKELIENSLDAKSSSITIEITNGGKNYIRVTDNGDGFAEDDLKIAFKRHSTSKLANIEDLYKIMSFGFRGEALASISAVSKMEVLTRTKNSLTGLQAFVENGEVKKIRPIGCPKGTTIIVRDLFYNLPVRENFLKSDTVEANNISDTIYRLALGNNGISFKYIKDNKVVFNISKNNDLISNVYILLGKEFSENLIDINYRSSDFDIFGYISNNTFYRSNRSHQYLYVNKRYVKNHFISNLIENKYKSIIPINRYPVFIIFIDINPLLIDVNIHPTKQEIKFTNQNEIGQVFGTLIENELDKILSIPKATFGKDKKDENPDDLPLLYEKTFLEGSSLENNSGYDILEAHKDRYRKEKKIGDINNRSDYLNNSRDKDLFQDKVNKEYDSELIYMLKNSRILGVLFSTFIVLENIEIEKVFVIDQHAAHERVMYEKYKSDYQSEKVVIQNLITPEIIELSHSEVESVAENIQLFRSLGFIVEEFGSNSVIIRGVPILFGEPQIKSLFMDLVDTIQHNIRSTYEIKLDKIIKIACTKAIKSGDNISNIEIQSLLKQLSKTENPYTCPHGRPTIIEISRKDIEKEFKRII